MSAGQPGGSRLRPCARCNALNGADFDHCIRCGTPLSAVAVGAARVSGRLGGERLLASKVLLALTTFVFAGQLAVWLPRGSVPILLDSSKVVILGALRFGALLISPAALVQEPWRMLSAVFVHFSVLHFGLNMLALINLSRIAEPAVGSARLVITYVCTGIFGFLASVLWGTIVSPSPYAIPTAGASGAIFGIMGLILGVLLRLRDPRWKQFAVQAVFYSLVFGLMIRANNAAHIGGLLLGIIFGLVFAGRQRGFQARPRSRVEFLVNLSAALGLLISIASVLLALRSPHWRLWEQDLLGQNRAPSSHETPEAPRENPGAPRPDQREARAPTRTGAT
ncbi:rhomboid family intramembrane serine protease [Chondromyces crocatus]|uniref:Peptidase S54 rhomboid domain-containing protein n=1 Tax=Chondromyces crocatus TaxID=52 RepID=A0A0K1EGM2_CHOCO|nr:rhomboid family intramembrane serine protease [Chondromyces crocatus]AKT39733.1 uncharacterized protein CMC5_038820 [Chondromyces crocatus]